MTLLGAWALDEGTGTTAADATGNGHTLTLSNATWTASGHTGAALTNTAADTGATGTVPAITGSAVTLMCWVKPLDLTAGTTHAAAGIFQAGGNTDIALFTQRGSFGTSNVLQADVRINGNLSACNGTSALTVGTWTHVAVTYDGSNIRLYRNGVLETTTAVSGTISLGTAFYVAGALAAASVDSDVVVDDPRLYNEVLDATAITTAKDTPVSGSSTVTGSATLAGTGTLAAGATQTVVAAATLGGVGTLAAAGTVAKSGSAALAGTGALSAAAIDIVAGAAILAGSSSLTAGGVDFVSGAATLAGTGTLAAAGSVTAVAVATLAGSGSLTAAATAAYQAAVALVGIGTLAAAPGGSIPGSATLAGTGQLAAAGLAVSVATAVLAATGALAATASRFTAAGAALHGIWTLAVLAGSSPVALDPRLTVRPNLAMLAAGPNGATLTVTAIRAVLTLGDNK